MLAIIGLGNIGEKYNETPHNAGFVFVDKLRDYAGYDALYSVDDWSPEKLAEASFAYMRSGGEKRVLLAKPTTLMNASGRTAREIVKMLELDVDSELVIVHDDLDLKLGEFKIQRGIGPKGHKGIHSIEALLGNGNFWRVRIGVDNRTGEYKIPGEDYVLIKMKGEELLTLSETIADAVKSLRSILEI